MDVGMERDLPFAAGIQTSVDRRFLRAEGEAARNLSVRFSLDSAPYESMLLCRTEHEARDYDHRPTLTLH